MTAIVETDRSRLSVLQAMLHGSVPLESMEALSEHIASAAQEFAVVIGPSIAVDDAAVFAQWARVHKPDLGVILLRETVDARALSTALRSGMREVVESRDLAGLTTAVSRARAVSSAIVQTMEDETQAAAQAALSEAQATAEAARAAAAKPTGRLITVFSTKGGVGKSLMAANTAVSLAERGHSVCIVDLDVNNGDIAIMLQLTPTRTLNDLAAFNGDIDVEAIETLVTPYSKTLGVVAAPVHLDSPDQATNEDIGKLLDLLVRVYDYVVVDTSGVFDDVALTALDRTDTLVLVGTLDIPALKGLKLAAQTLDLLNFPREKWKFVLNRADTKVGLSVEEYEGTLGLKADCSLVSSREVLTAVNRGEPLVLAYASHPNSKAIKAFATSIAGAARAAEADSDGDGKSRSTASRFRLRKA
ncbi:P-loop NTPase [Nocardioides sp.]|uniref:AAA family ATPase n=1 Tax=Nocardioides sp. TaxID=35761 RepID=UPI002634F705|nr:P-loop NTPase [Nocardioides sp.]MCW2736410.1 Pilus assembly protein CpaE [Nocardioides sp.]